MKNLSQRFARMPPVLAGFLVIMVLALFTPAQGFAGEEPQASPKDQFAFAGHLFDKAQYYRAVTEWERFLFYYPAHGLASRAQYMIGLSYYKGEKYDEAMEALRLYLGKYPSEEEANRARLLLCDSLLAKKDYPTAVQCLAAASKNPDLSGAALCKLGWMYIETGDWEAARDAFNQAKQTQASTCEADKLVKKLETIPSLDYKSPTTAGVLAIVPGAGHLYTRRYQDALLSFLLNAGLIFAAYESFDNDQNALGAVISLVAVGFYAGNIYGAVSSAHKYNKGLDDRLRQSLEQYAWDRSNMPSKSNGPMLALSIPW